MPFPHIMKIYQLFFLLICINLSAQNLNIKYKFEFLPKHEEYNSQLTIDGDESKYEIFEKNNLDSLSIQKESSENEILLIDKIFFNRIIFKKISSGILNVEFFKPNFSKTKELLRIVDNEQIKWTISKVSKLILNYSCYKAKGIYKNKEYEAWFCPELKHSDGPWKFRGLPGLILSVESLDNQLRINAYEITKSDEKLIFDLTENTTNYTWPEYIEYCRNYLLKLKSSLKSESEVLGNLTTEINVTIDEPDFKIVLKY
jgi:GLPGLI family protein